jgi:hypothetical protein
MLRVACPVHVQRNQKDRSRYENLKLMAGALLGAALIGGGVTVAQRPERDASGSTTASRQTWEKITEGQKANEWDLDGHAAKAKELLDQANADMKLAAEASNKHHK